MDKVFYCKCLPWSRGEIDTARWAYERFGSFLNLVHVTHGNLGPILYTEMAKGEDPWTLSRTILIKVIRLWHMANYTQKKGC